MSRWVKDKMIAYDSSKPIISLHIPKCAGQTFRSVLETWFKNKLFVHYFQQYKSLPPKHQLNPGICIHGHFNQTRRFGVQDYYPEINQFITVFRNPLEAAISNYFFWKTKPRNGQIKNKQVIPGSIHDYKNIDDFFQKRPKSVMLDFMPQIMTKENYKEIIEIKFVWIGLAENLQTHIDKLAASLGFPAIVVERLNTAYRDEEVSSNLCNEFMENNLLEYEIYNYVRIRLAKKE